MSDDEENEVSSSLDKSITSIGEITGIAIALAVVFSLIRNYIYYYLKLHIPIFQYFEIADIALVAPTAIWWALYYGSVEAANQLIESKKIIGLQKWGYVSLLYCFAIFLMIYGYQNDPIIRTGISLTFVLKYWWTIILISAYVLIRMRAKETGSDFFRDNRIVGIFILAIWYALFDSLASYSTLQKPNHQLHAVLKLKSGQKIITGQTYHFAGRTNGYWFLYNSKTHFVRTIKNDDIDLVDFDTYINN
ncbi:hypothetical protein ABID99_001114 [Mucilaginibacter sp. OAE612]|jgi:hypothetical protein|uniref:hypothetical protein n=1 Tax=Mucilaginibacter sp. OAE612 TaxID=3156444 RepID=UPI00359CC725